MKKIVLLTLFLITLLGCSGEDDHPNYSYEVIQIDSYTVPQSFILGQTYEIKLKYTRPSECHFYQGIYYRKDLNIRTIAIQTAVNKDQACVLSIPAQSEVSFNFYATELGSYIFKFYKGKDANGQNIFEEVEVPVTN